MKTKLIRIVLFTALLLTPLTPGLQVAARTGSAASKGVSPAGMLNPDGTLNLDGKFSGALDLSGYNVQIDPQRGPVFGHAVGGANASETASIAPLGNWASVGEGAGSVDDRVTGIAISGTNVYVVGNFTDVANIPTADFVAKWNGITWSALGSNGAGNGAIDFYTNAVAVSGTNVYIGGSFSHVYNGATYLNAAAHIAKWDGSNWSALGSDGAGGGSLNGVVNAIAVDGSGNVYAGGSFTNVNNNGTVLGAADYVAKWNGTNWSALGSNGSSDGSLNLDVYALAVGGTNVYVGGYFTNVNNNGSVLTAADRVARWNGANWSALGSDGAGNGSINNGYVDALAVSGTNVYVGGQFNDVNNNGIILAAADYIAKWDGAQWSALGSNGVGQGALNYTVSTILVNGTDVYAGGSFTDVNNNGAVLGAADYVAKWDGAHWSAIGSDGTGNGSIPNKSGPYVFALGLQGTNLLVGGWFYDVNNAGVVLPQADFIAQWNGANWSSLGSSVNGALVNGYTGSYVKAIAVMGTDVYVGGVFTNVSNHGINIPEANYIAKWDGANWSALGSDGAGGSALPFYVYALAVSGNNLYVGGGFSNVNNNGTVLPAADYIAKWDGTNWSALGDNGAGNGAINGSVFTIAVSGADVYVGGNFTNAAGIPQADYIARWNGSNWSALGNNGAGNGSLNSSVSVLAVSGSNVYVGGNFLNVNNNGVVLNAADYVAKWDGANWSALGSNGANNGSLNAGVYALAVSGAKLYVGGSFSDVNNNGLVLTAADAIAQWDGAKWSALGSNGSGNGALYCACGSFVNAIGINGADIYVGGWFMDVSNNGPFLGAADYVAKWDGANWSALGGNGAVDGSLNAVVKALVVNGADLLVGGSFTNVNNNGTVLTAADYLAAYGIVNLTPIHRIYLPLMRR